MWCLLNFTIIYIQVNTETHLLKSKSMRLLIQNMVTFCQILGVCTFILSITTCSSLSCLVNGIAHLAVDFYATSDFSPIPLLIFWSHDASKNSALPIDQVSWSKHSPVLVFSFPCNPKWSHVRVIVYISYSKCTYFPMKRLLFP